MMTLGDIWRHVKMRDAGLLRRDARLWWQRLRNGFDDSDLWDLDQHLAELILPRLRRYRAMDRMGIPGCFVPVDDNGNQLVPDHVAEAAWNAELDKMIAAFALLAVDNFHNPEHEAVIERGMEGFTKYFRALWD